VIPAPASQPLNFVLLRASCAKTFFLFEYYKIVVTVDKQKKKGSLGRRAFYECDDKKASLDVDEGLFSGFAELMAAE
jgi:hypothetical protein